MQAVERFWANAPSLFERLDALSAVLSQTSEIDDDVRARLRDIAEFIPPTPEPLADMDPYLRDALLTAVILALRAADSEDRASLLIAVERARQAVRDLLDERPVWAGGAKHAVVWLVHTAGVAPADLDDLLGVSDSTVRRWANLQNPIEPKGDVAERVIVVAKVVNHLRHAMTPRGVIKWLKRSHPSLDDRRPLDELKDPDSYRALIHLASGTRSVTAS